MEFVLGKKTFSVPTLSGSSPEEIERALRSALIMLNELIQSIKLITTPEQLAVGGNVGQIQYNADGLVLGGYSIDSNTLEIISGVLGVKTGTYQGAGSYQPLNAILTAIAALASSAGYLKNDGLGNFSYVPETKMYRAAEIICIDYTTNCSVGVGKGHFRVPIILNNMNMIFCSATCITAGTTGTMGIQLRNKTTGYDILSTPITIDSGETDSITAETPAIINPTYKKVNTGNLIEINVDTIHTTAAKGLIVVMEFGEQ